MEYFDCGGGSEDDKPPPPPESRSSKDSEIQKKPPIAANRRSIQDSRRSIWDSNEPAIAETLKATPPIDPEWLEQSLRLADGAEGARKRLETHPLCLKVHKVLINSWFEISIGTIIMMNCCFSFNCRLLLEMGL